MYSQHIKTVSLINQIHNANQANKPKKVFDEVLEELIDQIERHFISEYELMAQNGYSIFSAYEAEFENFYNRFLDLYKKNNSEDHNISNDLIILLNKWIAIKFN